MGTGNTNNPNLLRSGLDKGVKLLDTSENYQDVNNEKMVGSVLKKRHRDSFMIMTRHHTPSITKSAPAQNALAISPGVVQPPSLII